MALVGPDRSWHQDLWQQIGAMKAEEEHFRNTAFQKYTARLAMKG